MDDEPNYYRTTTSLEPEEEMTKSCGGGSEWIWIILLLIAILAIIGLVIWLIFSYRRDTKGKILQLNNPKINITSNTQITGSWTSTGNASDKITLYATLNPPEYNNDGTLANPSPLKNNASGVAESVSVPGLQQGLKYYATLILTNSNTTNFQVYTQIVFMQDKDVPTVVPTSGQIGSTPNIFAIDDILQVGKIEFVEPDNSGIYSVRFNQIPNDTNSLWTYTAAGTNSIGGQIKSTREGEDICLFNSNGNLVAQSCTGITGAAGNVSADSQWTYNPTGNANKWCLTSTVTNANPTCMILGTINTKGTAPITVANTSTVGDAWALAFQNIGN